MSAYSDWKYGALSDSEYRSEMAREARRDRAIEEAEWAYLDELDDEDDDWEEEQNNEHD